MDTKLSKFPPRKHFPYQKESFETLLADARSLQDINITDYSFWIETRHISPNKLQTQRFVEINKKIFFISTRSISDFYEKFQEFLETTSKELYVRGPAGVGKSFNILYLVLSLRQEKTHRVLYLNNPQGLETNRLEYLLKEVVYMMAEDFDIWEQDHTKFPFNIAPNKSPRESLLETLSDLELTQEEAPFLRILQAYKKYCSENKKYLFIFVDQFTQLQRLREKSSDLHKFCYEFLKYSDRKVFGTSDSSNQAASSLHPEIILEEKFTLGEAVFYLAEKLKDSLDNLGLPPGGILEDSLGLVILENYPNLARIRDSTDLLPYELEVFCTVAKTKPQEDFNEIFEAFYTRRYFEVLETHNNWLKHYSFIHERTQDIIFKMSLGIRERHFLHGLISPDPNLFYIDTKVKPEEVRFSSKVVENSLYRLYSQTKTWSDYVEAHLQENLSAIKTLIHGNQDGSGPKGTLFEKYFSYKMEIASNRAKIVSEKSDKKLSLLYFRNSSNIEQSIDLSDISLLKRFNDTELFSLLEDYHDKDKFVAFIPNSPSFGPIDFVLFDSRNGKHIIYLIQTSTDILSHKKSSTLLEKEMNAFADARHDLQKQTELKKTTSPLSHALDKALLKIPSLKFEFIWVGLAWDQSKKEYLTEASDIFKKTVVRKQDQVALVQANQRLFHDILHPLKSAA